MADYVVGHIAAVVRAAAAAHRDEAVLRRREHASRRSDVVKVRQARTGVVQAGIPGEGKVIGGKLVVGRTAKLEGPIGSRRQAQQAGADLVPDARVGAGGEVAGRASRLVIAADPRIPEQRLAELDGSGLVGDELGQQRLGRAWNRNGLEGQRADGRFGRHGAAEAKRNQDAGKSACTARRRPVRRQRMVPQAPR
jgi:hypothetical protein